MLLRKTALLNVYNMLNKLKRSLKVSCINTQVQCLSIDSSFLLTRKGLSTNQSRPSHFQSLIYTESKTIIRGVGVSTSHMCSSLITCRADKQLLRAFCHTHIDGQILNDQCCGDQNDNFRSSRTCEWNYSFIEPSYWRPYTFYCVESKSKMT